MRRGEADRAVVGPRRAVDGEAERVDNGPRSAGDETPAAPVAPPGDEEQDQDVADGREVGRGAVHRALRALFIPFVIQGTLRVRRDRMATANPRPLGRRTSCLRRGRSGTGLEPSALLDERCSRLRTFRTGQSLAVGRSLIRDKPLG